MRQSFSEYAKPIIESFIKYLEAKSYLLESENRERQLKVTATLLAEVEFALFLLTKVDEKERNPRAIQYLIYSHNMPYLNTLPTIYQYAIQKLNFFKPEWRIESILLSDLKRYEAITSAINRQQIKLDLSLNEERFQWQTTGLWDKYGAYDLLCKNPLNQAKVEPKFLSSVEAIIEREEPHTFSKVTIPSWMLQEEAHQVPKWKKASREKIAMKWSDLEDAAGEMDSIYRQDYLKRFQQLSLFTGGQLKEIHDLTVEGTEHWVGPLGVGKSTLIKVLSYYLTKKSATKKRVTIFVKDIAEVIELVEEFNHLHIKAEAIVSHNERKKHVAKYLLYMRSKHAKYALHQYNSPLAKRFLSTCPLLGYNNLQDKANPPCFQLVEVKAKDEIKSEEQIYRQSSKKCICPYFSTCSYTSMYHNLEETEVFVTTIQSALNTFVPSVVIDQKMTYYEFFNQYSDIVLMDEADKHQVTLDEEFMKRIDIFDERQMFLNNLQFDILQKTHYLSLKRTNLLAKKWLSNLDKTLYVLGDILYRIDNDISKEYVTKFLSKHRFTSVKLLRHFFVLLCFGQKDFPKNPDKNQLKRFNRFSLAVSEFNGIYKTPIYYQPPTKSKTVLCFLEIAHNDDEEAQLFLAREWLQKLFRKDYKAEDEQNLIERLVLAINFSKLEKYLGLLANHYPAIEKELDNSTRNYFHFFSKQRALYDGVVPAPAIGVQYGFLHDRSPLSAKQYSKLQAYHYKAIGRHLLINYSHLYEGFHHEQGAHAILLSATSFAPHSPKFNVQLPVKKVLTNKKQQSPKIHYTFKPIYDRDHAIRVSGVPVTAVNDVIRKLGRELVKQQYLSTIQQTLPTERQRILVVVSSYDKAKTLAKALIDAQMKEEELAVLVRTKEAESVCMQLTRDEIPRIVSSNPLIKYVIIPLSAIDRGMNILLEDDSGRAAFSAIVYCMRPYPVPSNLSERMRLSNIYCLNHYNVRESKEISISEQFNEIRNGNFSVLQAGFSQYGYEALGDDERLQMLMDYQVITFQLEGRLIRGQTEAYVYFLDSAFMPKTAQHESDTPKTSMIEGWRMLNTQLVNHREGYILSLLYKSRWEGLANLKIDLPEIGDEIDEDYGNE